MGFNRVTSVYVVFIVDYVEFLLIHKADDAGVGQDLVFVNPFLFKNLFKKWFSKFSLICGFLTVVFIKEQS